MSNRTSLHNWLTLFSGYEKSATEFYSVLKLHYSEDGRYYHNLKHISECLRVFDDYRSHFQNPRCAEIALWCHDVIYSPLEKDNEEKSAKWAVNCMLTCGFKASTSQKIHEMITATKVHVGEAHDVSLINDIDLTILGSSNERFIEYCDAIRKEFEKIPDETYFPKRRNILKNFLDRDEIYTTKAIRQIYENNARINLSQELQKLC